MKRLLVAIALTTGTVAFAQTEPETTPYPPPETEALMPAPAPDPALTPAPAPMTIASTGSIQMPGNTNPERDARGILVISDPAVVPAGYNGTPATGMGGPQLDPVTGEEVNPTDTAHPPCTAEITDNCLQTYERGRSPQ